MKLIKSDHPWHYRRGEWARIIKEDVRSDGRPIALVVFEDNDSDIWVTDDELAEYEILDSDGYEYA